MVERKRPIFRRNFLCCWCGSIRRADGNFLHQPEASHGPTCCNKPMRLLGYEQTVAATRLTKVKRLDWIAGGGKVMKSPGRRRWKAVK